MPTCNDPKCLLIRQGIQHDAHDKIEDLVIDQCNDPRCATNRKGISHNRHDKYFKRKNPEGSKAEPQDDRQENNGQEYKPQQDYSGSEQESQQNPDG